jgi:hypothetical protein
MDIGYMTLCKSNFVYSMKLCTSTEKERGALRIVVAVVCSVLDMDDPSQIALAL